jgi:NodT family efflux transporter outer membrane factor (OMF) lipoprotein
MQRGRFCAAVGLGAVLAGCSLAPDYKVPATPSAKEFKEAGIWSKATPEDQLPRGAWWEVFNDPTLDRLEQQLDASNPNLAVALARYDEARADFAEARAGLFPFVGTGYNPTYNRQSNNRPLRGADEPDTYMSNTVDATVSYEIDLWGSVRNTVAAGAAQAEAGSALLANAKLSLESELADSYISLRGLDAQDKVLADTVAAYERAYKMTVDRHNGGIASGLDVGRAETQLEDARAEASQDHGQRALYEHAIASLVGESSSNFSIAPEVVDLKIPNIPVGVPSTLLQRRPDVAAAERQVAAANAGIGVARAAFFPNLTLSGAIGYQNTGNGSLLSAPNLFWTIGPSLAMTLFQGGLRHAQLDLAKAQRNEAAGSYRATVLQAFQDVEDNLGLLNHLANAEAAQSAAVMAASHTEDLALDRYLLGAVNYLEVVVAQTAALEAKQSAIDINTSRLAAAVGLIKAIGGGWTTADMPILAEADSCPHPGGHQEESQCR